MKSLCFVFSLLLLATAAMPLPSTTPSAARAAPLAVLDVTTWSGMALVHFSTGAVLVTNAATGEALAEYGNPEVVTHFKWTSGGIEITVDVRSQAGESEAKYAERCAETVEKMKAVFPPDPPPSAG